MMPGNGFDRGSLVSIDNAEVLGEVEIKDVVG